MIIAIDGPAATGKSTTAKLVAQQLLFTYLDTGAMYRCVTLAVLQSNIPISESTEMDNLLENIQIRFDVANGRSNVKLNGRDVSDDIRMENVTQNVSAVSLLKSVRTKMVRFQQEIAANTDCVVEGRDIGTVVFPNAEIKIFLTCDLQTRAKRRMKDLEQMGEIVSLDHLINEIKRRDAIDSTRAISPLRKALDAIEVDTSNLTIDEQVSRIIEIVKHKQHKTENNK